MYSNDLSVDTVCFFDTFPLEFSISFPISWFALFYGQVCDDRYYFEGCDNPECEYDGLDCDQSEEKLSKGTMVIVVGVSPAAFHNISSLFLRWAKKIHSKTTHEFANLSQICPRHIFSFEDFLQLGRGCVFHIGEIITNLERNFGVFIFNRKFTRVAFLLLLVLFVSKILSTILQ